MQIGQLYRQVRDQFRQAELQTPDLDAKLLVSAALKISISELVLDEHNDVSSEDAEKALTYAKQRLEGKPVGRILGEREFYGRRFGLNAATLEPRPDTETLVDAVLERSDPDRALLMCDVGTGTGAIAISVLAELPRSRMIAIDLSEDALICASENAAMHKVCNRFYPVCADYLSALRTGSSGKHEGEMDWVISNPPYIRSSVLSELSDEVIHHDPKLALDGGKNGLDAYVSIIEDAGRLLRANGQIAFEIGYDQADEVKKQLRHHGFVAIEIIKDLSGNDRVAVARKA
ncbi:MAG: peptide chain release factor N(5)-glutamine methyltransferase [Roseibium sp.]|uniref:peptide chain release factor N(5)-glutamine methyltransferase n=1 Tax=Roseibium sp. TaxID=1936156 RepID=UPI00261FAB9C|nr:peptide chain release factor N(5)-glutamine methyltransferase [Roseibium sp.]MCV0424537.1 peptide chain release factor N(5)-glutamine methyltransferase [Roseibium sp.]